MSSIFKWKAVLIWITSIVFYCEFLHYYFVLYQCDWLKLKFENAQLLKLMVVADTHLLGTRNGHWFDKLRREWQMYRTFQTAMQLQSPDAVVFLGDLFDEGQWSSESEFISTVERFHSMFHVPKTAELLIAAGNHDIGFHYKATPYYVSRFDKTFFTSPVQQRVIKGNIFVILNSLAFYGDDCSLCKPARLKLLALSKEFDCASGKTTKNCNTQIHTQNYTQPIILQHFPLFRKSDSHCHEVDGAPENIKNTQFRPQWDCLSKESSNLVTISNDEFQTYKCKMPIETTIINIYFWSSLIITFYMIILTCKTARHRSIHQD